MNIDNRFEIKYNGIHPDTIPLSDLREYLKSVEQFILGIWREHHYESDEPPKLSLVNIESGSTTFALVTDKPEAVIPIVKDGFDTIASGNIDALPTSCRGVASALARAAQRWGVSEVIVKKEVIATIPNDIVIDEHKQVTYVKGYTQIYGRLQRLGGEKPSALIKPDSGDKGIICYISEKLAQTLGPRLYTRVGLSGIAYYDSKDWSIHHFEVETILEYRDTPISEALQHLYEASPTAWSHVDDVDEYFRELRGEEDVEC